MKQCVIISIVGKVQGVGYRKYVQKQAQSLNIEGIVQNCTETNMVQVKACGQATDLDNFIGLLYKGPSLSKIESVTVEPLMQEKNFREVFRVIGD